MLSDLGAVIQAAYNIMAIEFTIYGYTLSWWEIMLYLMVGGILIYAVVRFMR